MCLCAQAIEIRRKSDAFNERVEDFRKFFLRSAPFAVPNFVTGPNAPTDLKLEMVRPAYTVLNEFHHGSVKCVRAAVQVAHTRGLPFAAAGRAPGCTGRVEHSTRMHCRRIGRPCAVCLDGRHVCCLCLRRCPPIWQSLA